MATINLKAAIELAGIKKGDMFWLLRKDDGDEYNTRPFEYGKAPLSYKTIIVHGIRPNIDFDGEYRGMEFTVTGVDPVEVFTAMYSK